MRWNGSIPRGISRNLLGLSKRWLDCALLWRREVSYRRLNDPFQWIPAASPSIFQNVYGFTDSLNVCKFGTFAIPLAVYASLYSSMTGVPLEVDDLLTIGERVYNLERYYNNINGFREGSDYLPKRFLEEPGAGAAEN
jgi:aldehyde:ferredoxin oxidoreductase